MSFLQIVKQTGLWDCALREFESHGAGCEMMLDLMKMLPLSDIETNLEKARQRRSVSLPKANEVSAPNKPHWQDDK
jgi:hypothetical protein